MRSENLALIYQEVFTVIVRVRAGRQGFSDVDSFRHHMAEAVKTAEQRAVIIGYAGEDIKMATMAVVGFLDESIMTARNALFADWQRKPLGLQLFQTHLAGVIFFENVDQLISRSDSPDLGDVLEVHYLCLLLGFTGRFSAGGRGELQAVMANLGDKLRRIRGPRGELSPSWAPTAMAAPQVKDRATRWFMIAAATCLALALVLFVTFKISLNSGTSDLRSIPSLKKV